MKKQPKKVDLGPAKRVEIGSKGDSARKGRFGAHHNTVKTKSIIKMKRRGDRTTVTDYVRISLSIPRDLWPFFERQRKRPQHAGNRSSYVRSLILEQMEKGRK